MVNNLDFKKLVEYTQSSESQERFAQIVVRNRIRDILFGNKHGHLSEENAIKFIEEIIADQKEIARKKLIDTRLSESDGVE